LSGTYRFRKVSVSSDLVPPGYSCVRRMTVDNGYSLALIENKKLSVTPWYGYAWPHNGVEVGH
jgi:hypothetical protein